MPNSFRILKRAERPFRFGIVGIAAAFTYAVLAFVFVTYVKLPDMTATICAYLMAIPVSFFGQKLFTFQSKGDIRTEAGKFFALQLFCLIAAAATTKVLGDVLHFHPVVGIIAVCGLIPAISYLVMKFFVFLNNADPAQ